MVFIEEIKFVQTYVISESETIIGDTVYCEYGITQSSVYNNNHTEIVTINGISTDKVFVESLVKRMKNEIVDPITLQYIVEDYLGEVFGV
ncbi:MAG: DUF6514 family protein [Oscillospiraceae bacterium]